MATIDIQRLRNLTTCKLHTEIGHVYEDIEFFIGSSGLFTHMLPNANRALSPFLRQQFTDARLWDGQYDVTHIGEVEARPMDDAEKAEFWKRYEALPSALSLINEGPPAHRQGHGVRCEAEKEGK